MHVHMSGQMSGQVTNQAGSQLPVLPQQNGNSIPSQMQSLTGLRTMDQDLPPLRQIMKDKIAQFLLQRQMPQEMRLRLPDVVRRLEEWLFKDASSKEEYMNMESLEHRLQTLVKRLFHHNHNQHQQISHHMSSSSSIGTMMPTPGMAHSGNSHSTITSSGDNAMTSTSMVTPNAISSVLSSTNGSVGLHGGSFSASDGSLVNGYQHPPTNISMASGANMMSSMGMPRAQMIPTPGLNNTQPMPMSSDPANGGGFSTVDSVLVSQQQQPKQYIGNQNSRILQSLGGQMGIGVRSNLQQKAASYGYGNGAINGGMSLIGNSMQLINGSASSDGFLNVSAYGNSPKPVQQHFDQQRQQQLIHSLPQQMVPLASDMYGMNGTDVSGSGNLYNPTTSVGATMTNQNMNPVGLQSKLKTNSGILGHQANLQTMQQSSHLKAQTLDQSQKMNFQSSHSTREQLMQSQQQMQRFHQQPFSQFAHHQHQQKQQNQQHQQLLLKNDILRQSQLASNMGGQLIPEQGLESHSEVLHTQLPEQYHLSELQNQCQQQSSAVEDVYRGSQILCNSSNPREYNVAESQTSHQIQSQPNMQPLQQIVESHNDFSSLSAGSQSEALLQGQWHPQPLEKPDQLLPDQSSFEQHVQEEFRHRISGQDEAQQPRVSLEGSMASQTAAPKGTPLLQVSSGATCEPVDAFRFRKQVKWLLFLFHARHCQSPEGKCIEINCITVQKLLMHMGGCKGPECRYPRCRESKVLLAHYKNCKGDCPVCVHVRKFLQQTAARLCSLSDDGSAANSANGSWKSVDAGDASRAKQNNGTLATETSGDLQSSKRLKVEHPSPSIVPKTESSPVSVVSMNQTHSMQEAQSQAQIVKQTEAHHALKTEVKELKTEQSSASFGLAKPPQFIDVKKDDLVAGHAVKPDSELIIQNEVSAHAKQENMPIKKEMEQTPVDVRQENTARPADTAGTTKSGKPKIKGVSLTELFTPEQVRNHIKGLRQWVGQSKAKAEKNQAMEHSMSENSCQLCAVEKLTFEPPPIYCTPCGARIKRNAMFYTVGTGDTRHYFCIPCYNEVRGDTIEVDGSAVPKARLEKKRNDEETEEWWVQCDKCEAWQHQICALFNGRRNDGGQAEYTCPNCYIQEIERGERKPLSQSAVLGAKDLPRTILSDHIEQRLAKQLRQERQNRARVQGKSIDEVPEAESLVIRVVSSVDKKLEVKQRFLEIFQEENYPTEFPYKSKVILLFQKIEGVEVCLFGMYVQEFGSECQLPNQRRVYLSYLDSVKYFRPEIKTVTGEALRTYVYHEILIAYLEYCKLRGFTSCYIWACPPLKGEDYILYCHPEIQKTPKSDKLREWYLSMLRKAAKENIVVDLTNLYDHFFTQMGECKAKITAARLPYFDGDYWPGAAEDMINQLRQEEEDGRRQQKKGKTKKTITKRALKAAGQADLSGNASKDALLMQKLGETISPMKEDFIMVHLQHACNHCCHLMVSGNRWLCGQCKNFQLCDKCYDAEQKREDKERHPIHSKEKHSFSVVEITDVPADTKDKDEILESEFFDTRQAFLSLCQGNHYQYDTLRRAKHSSMMVLYHLHNPTEPAFVTTCNVCLHDIEAGKGWRCEVCPDFDVCNGCYQKDGGVDHPHKLTNHPSSAERDAQNKEARQKRVQQLRKMLDLLVHAYQCRFPHCKYPNCRQVKGLFRHGIQCRTRVSGGCVLCKKMWYLLQLHARACKESECNVPRCKDLKEHMRRLQHQSDSRRRAAVMEMMRQRAAEVAGNAG
ncbi:histone acetyltransferase HAC1-like [Aristolochia californica]|uniref:histone acetyltransferase HAC1-like n=1 Tax=Aristolochia californica TaxID=171875 RepID=UPI0035D53106